MKTFRFIPAFFFFHTSHLSIVAFKNCEPNTANQKQPTEIEKWLKGEFDGNLNDIWVCWSFTIYHKQISILLSIKSYKLNKSAVNKCFMNSHRSCVWNFGYLADLLECFDWISLLKINFYFRQALTFYFSIHSPYKFWMEEKNRRTDNIFFIDSFSSFFSWRKKRAKLWECFEIAQV